MGKIVSSDNSPLEAANVYLSGTIMGAATNFEGHFKIENIPTGLTRTARTETRWCL